MFGFRKVCSAGKAVLNVIKYFNGLNEGLFYDLFDLVSDYIVPQLSSYRTKKKNYYYQNAKLMH